MSLGRLHAVFGININKIVEVQTRAQTRKQPGSVICDANVGLLVGPGAKHPKQSRCFNWQTTLDGGDTFLTQPSTPLCKTLIQGLTPLATLGVRVSMSNAEGPGAWSQIVTILVL